ncbi:DUF5684 domain-containing protein [bacterium]|nr:DUF5684 domain-containing protein [bacterium]
MGGGLLAALAGVGAFIYVAVILLMVIANWKIYTKAGKPGWACIIPVYNLIVLLEIVGKPLWWIILLLIPGVNIVILIIIMNLLSKSFGKGVGFTLGLIFLGIIFIPILGFGSAKYVGPAGE